MKNKRIFKDFQASQMRLNLYTSPLLAFVFVFIGEFVAYTLYGISLLALIGLARNFGEAGQNLAAYLQTLHQSLTDKTSDFHLILDWFLRPIGEGAKHGLPLLLLSPVKSKKG